MNFVAGLYEKAFKKVSTLDALIKIIDSLRKHAKKGFCGDLLKGLGSNSGNKSLVSDLSKSEFLACLYGYIRDFEDEEPTDDKATEEIIKNLLTSSAMVKLATHYAHSRSFMLFTGENIR